MYNISAVSSLTRVNAITLRAWERRYGLIRPARTPKGHRLYSEQDISTIKQVVKLLDQGIALSQVNQYLSESHSDQASAAGTWQPYQDRMLKAVVDFDEQGLENIYNETMSLYPVDLVTQELLIPIFKILGERWQNHNKGVGEEHFFVVFIRNKLGSRFHHRNLNNHGPRLLVACLPDEQHELGLLLFSLAAHERDYRIILLGGNMPMDELADIAQQTGSAAIILSATTVVDSKALLAKLTGLVNTVNIPVFIGGQITTHHREIIQQADAIATSDDFTETLNIISHHLKHSGAKT